MTPGTSNSRSRTRGRALLALTVIAILLPACTSSYRVKVDAVNNPAANPDSVSYAIVNATAEEDSDSLRYKEAVGFVKTALSGKGMYEAPQGVKPDLVVAIDYGIGPPKVTEETVLDPIYRMVEGDLREVLVKIGVDANGKPVYKTMLVQDPPHAEHVGDEIRKVTVVTYEKHLSLAARENVKTEDNKVESDIWRVDVSSEGETHDLRKTLPVLAAATIDYIGKDTRGEKTIRLAEDHGDVAFVKKGM